MGPTAGRARSGAGPPAQPGAGTEAVPEFLSGPPPETAAGIRPEANPDAAPATGSAATPDAAPGTAGIAPEATPGATPGATDDATPEATPGAAPEATDDAAPGATPGAADLPQVTPGGHWSGRPGAPTGPWTPGPDHGSIPPLPADALRARLASDPRKSIWILRAVASAAAGIIVSVLADWRLGLTAAAVIAIADTIHRSRTTAAIPAAIRAPSAHRRTRRRLARLDRAGYRALHARAVPGSECVIDHLVVGPGGVYTVDSERWDRRLPVRATKGGKLYHGPFGQADRLTHALWAADEARRLLSVALGQQLIVKPAMVIYGPTIPWTVASVGGVDVFCGRRLRKYLQQSAKASSVARLDAGEIERIHAAAAHVLPPTR
jgi:hypothetical protein